MKNRHVGIIIIAFSLLMGIMIWLFNRALTDIVNESCSHGPTCPMWGSINFHTLISLSIMILILLIGIYIAFFAKDEESHHHTHRKKSFDRTDFEHLLNELSGDERFVYSRILDGKGSIFQSELVDNDKYSKVRITRILDRLESKGLIERRRRGMTNIILLKH